jgi:hypothetical protein
LIYVTVREFSLNRLPGITWIDFARQCVQGC